MIEHGILPEEFAETTGRTAESFSSSLGTAEFLARRAARAAGIPEVEAPDDGKTSMPCTEQDPEMFFPIPEERTMPESGLSYPTAYAEDAKGVCNTCIEEADCLISALSHREPYGIWGGETTPKREAMLLAAQKRRDEMAQNLLPKEVN